MNTIDVVECAECGKDHEDLEVKYIAVPVRFCGYDYNYFTICPDTQNTIYIKYFNYEYGRE